MTLKLLEWIWLRTWKGFSDFTHCYFYNSLERKWLERSWFGKYGISWHVSVLLRKSESRLQWQGFIYVIQSCIVKTRRLVRNLKGGINSNWQGYSPLTPNVKIAINKSRRTTQHFFPHAFRAKADSMCHMYPVEDCVNLGGTRVIYSNYHTRNMTPSALSI